MASVGSWSEAAIDGGVFDSLLRLLAQYPRHALCVHEYARIHMAWDFTQEWTISKWPAWGKARWPEKQTDDSIIWRLPLNYHIGRHEWFNIRADELGIARPRIIIGELGMDNVSDLDNDPTVQQFERDFNGGNKFRGAQQYGALWHAKFGVDLIRAYTAQLDWYLRNLADNVIGAELFFWEEGGPWYEDGYNIGGQTWAQLHVFMLSRAAEAPKEDETMAEDWQLKVVTGQRVRMHLTPALGGSVNPVLWDTTDTIWQDVLFSQKANGYTWLKFKRQGSMDVFYMAKEVITIENVPDATPTPQTSLLLNLDAELVARLKAGAATVADLVTVLESVSAAVENWEE
jgi:hypothetical protein